MQQTLCLWLCLLVLFGALCAGNPFLDAKDAAARPALPGGSGDEGLVVGLAPPGGRVHALQAGAPAEGRGAVRALADAAAAPAVLPVALHASGPVDASSQSCPDAALRPLVVATERGPRGETVWVLGDGRRYVRNHRAGAGQPLLLLVADDVR